MRKGLVFFSLFLQQDRERIPALRTWLWFKTWLGTDPHPTGVFFGEDHSTGTDLSFTTRFDEMARAMGGYGEKVTQPEQIKPAFHRALDSGKPAVVNVILDPKGLADEASTRELAI